MTKLYKLFIVTFLVLSSCEFLDEEPLGSPVSDEFYSSLNEVQLGVNAIYEVLTNGTFQNGYAYIGTGRGDNMVVVESQRFTPTADLFKLTANSLDPMVSGFWSQNYRGIFRANQVISKARYMRTFDSNNLQNNQENLRIMMGEAKFLRAFYYFNLVRTYGGVPIKPEELVLKGDEDNFIQPRSSVEEVYAYIEKDLREAAIALDRRQVGGNDVSILGKITEGAAWSMLLKVLVYQANPGDGSVKWQQAKAVGDHIVARTNAALSFREILNFDQLYEDPAELERIKQDLVFEHLTDEEFLDGSTAGMGDSNNSYDLNFQYAFLNRESADFSSEAIFEVNHVVLPDNTVNLSSPFHTGVGSSNILQPTKAFASNYISDPRARIMVMTSGTTLPDGTVVGNPPFPDKTACYKWHTLNNERAGVKNFTIMRYADVVLLYAEALNETGDQPGATEQLNRIRARARNIVNAGDPRVSSSTEPADYGLANYLDTRKRIWNERRIELCFEFDRFWDLVRTGQAQSAIAAYNGVVEAEYRKDFVKGVSEVLPIPQTEVDASGGVVLQNPGY
ncbi:RagB/SusD family nutrient uptake outer membrane protein [Marinoscillum furvescens]|uniref:Putative outer membrane starch-binding protein n=1 Tax=Marinoscillum furvescens DSM 4134 TaxID=1122208 RepID=A0A3D9L427_MARFU|nr:RagB/SusD family nutrient uptake outer membrane protein [Marinoscillum furvescens]REE00168.1 putative outer membrane starch-binding protein [Marinoscillum furvescens DSM 4134]